MRIHSSRPDRAAFTLIELLIVVGIIAGLLALAAGVFFKVRKSQEDSATVVTIQKLGSTLERQYAAVLDNAKQDAKSDSFRIPAWVRTMSEQDPRRAHVIWAKIQLKYEFPQSFWEVLVWQPSMTQYSGQVPKSSYIRSLTGIAPNAVLDPAAATPAQYEQLHRESAALLYMALAQSRRGEGGFKPTEHLGPQALGKVTLYGRDFDCFVDTWGRPIGYVRWAFDSQWSDLNTAEYRVSLADPQDPEGTLVDVKWTAANRNTVAGILGHPIVSPPRNLIPVIFSGGPDRGYGISPTFANLGDGAEDDNIYSYRHRGVGRK